MAAKKKPVKKVAKKAAKSGKKEMSGCCCNC